MKSPPTSTRFSSRAGCHWLARLKTWMFPTTCIVWLSGGASALVLEVSAQGTVCFDNLIIDQIPDARVWDLWPSRSLLTGTNFLARLYFGLPGTPEGDLKPVSEPSVPFRTGPRAGFVDVRPSSVRVLPGIPPGASALVQIRAWTAVSGSSYEEAVATARARKTFEHRFGASSVLFLQYVPAPGQLPQTLGGLESFAIRPWPYVLHLNRFGNLLTLSWPAADPNYVLGGC
jgi:hypothetical protein